MAALINPLASYAVEGQTIFLDRDLEADFQAKYGEPAPAQIRIRLRAASDFAENAAPGGKVRSERGSPSPHEDRDHRIGKHRRGGRPPVGEGRT